MGAEICYSGRIDFDEPVPTAAIPEELAELRVRENDGLFRLDFVDDGLAGLIMGDNADFGHTFQRGHVLHLLETIAREQGRTLTCEATWMSDPGPYSGKLVIDSGGRFDDVLAGDDRETHQGARCGCFSPTACERCGDPSFLARDEDAPGRPALCMDCHEKLGTRQAAEGHCCRDGCTLPTSHDGLCFP
ncbi:hypothetical protein [Streptomyces qinglanensis]|uniref:hypothetical protein n=1 Tax=Streptomyces qinglanensis TaxID=943816 RepID=UPI003D7440C1